MKISFITNINSIHSRRWINPLISAGYEISVLSYDSKPRELPGVTNQIDLSKISNIRKVRFLYWGLWVRRFLQKYQPDILHSHQIQAAGWIGAITNYHPFIVSAWGSDLLVEPNKSSFRRFLTKMVLRRCNYLTVPSQQMYKAAVELGFPMDRIKLIPWGVESDIFNNILDDKYATKEALNIPHDAPVIFCPRRIAKICNIDIVVEAVYGVLVSYPELRLLLIIFSPEPDYFQSVKRQVSALGMNNQVIWLPEQQSQYDMARLYRMSDVVVSIPSSEGYGFTVFEAMLSGIPVIITDLPVFEDDILNHIHAIKVPNRNVKKTSSAILEILGNDKLRQFLLENTNQVTAQHRVDARINLVENFYQDIFNQRRKHQF